MAWLIALAAIALAARAVVADGPDVPTIEARVAAIESALGTLEKRLGALEAAHPPAPPAAAPPAPAPDAKVPDAKPAAPAPQPAAEWTMTPLHRAALQKVARLISLGYSIRGNLDGGTLAALNEIPWGWAY